MIAFLLIFNAAWVFTGKYIYETAAYVDQECWGNLSNRPEEFHPRYWGIETGHDLSAWWFVDSGKGGSPHQCLDPLSGNKGSMDPFCPWPGKL